MNVIIYTRESKPEQLKKCKEYAAENKMNVICNTHSHDDLFSAKGIDAVLVSSLRGLDSSFRESAYISGLLQLKGLEVICANGESRKKETLKDTIIITKDGWKFLRNQLSVLRGYGPKTDETLERLYNRIRIKNGAGDEYPISENEIRVDKSSCGFEVNEIEELLKNQGLPCRIDGFQFRTMKLF